MKKGKKGEKFKQRETRSEDPECSAKKRLQKRLTDGLLGEPFFAKDMGRYGDID